MYKKLIIKKIIDIVVKQILKLFDLDKIQKYVDQPNELDRKVSSIEKKIKKLEKRISKLEKK